jgi:hypothetical protein
MSTPENLSLVKIGEVYDLPHLEWASDLHFSITPALANHLLSSARANSLSKIVIHSTSINNETIHLAKKAFPELRLKAAFTNNPPLSSRLPINYQYVPSLIRDVIAKCVGRIKRQQITQWARFPTWPIDLSADFVADLSSHESSPFINRPTPVLLTHDLDSPEGLKNVVRYFLDIEEAVFARSSNYIVPCSWSIDYNLLDEISSRGHEIGIHGFDHSNKTPFLTSIERQKRLLSAKHLINHYNIQGYRAPSLLRTAGLLQDLAKIYRYDSSIPTSGGLFPIPNNGCASARPFKVHGIWEIPLSMPRDGSLLFLGYSYSKILETWINCAELIAKSGGVINLLTHCEYRFSGKPKMLSIYKHFLHYLANSGKYKFMLAKDILKYLPSDE